MPRAGGCLDPSRSDKGGSVVSRFARRPSHRGPSRLTIIALLAAALLAGAATPARAATPAATPGRAATRAAAPSAARPKLFFTGKPDAAAFRGLCEGELQTAKKELDRMLAAKGKRTI